jgi:DNA-binding CsgD family transcriptional regulator
VCDQSYAYLLILQTLAGKGFQCIFTALTSKNELAFTLPCCRLQNSFTQQMKTIKNCGLTKLELELLLYLSNGNTEEVILEKMNISKKYYTNTVKSILEKTGYASLVHLLTNLIFKN